MAVFQKCLSSCHFTSYERFVEWSTISVVVLMKESPIFQSFNITFIRFYVREVGVKQPNRSTHTFQIFLLPFSPFCTILCWSITLNPSTKHKDISGWHDIKQDNIVENMCMQKMKGLNISSLVPPLGSQWTSCEAMTLPSTSTHALTKGASRWWSGTTKWVNGGARKRGTWRRPFLSLPGALLRWEI